LLPRWQLSARAFTAVAAAAAPAGGGRRHGARASVQKNSGRRPVAWSACPISEAGGPLERSPDNTPSAQLGDGLPPGGSARPSP